MNKPFLLLALLISGLFHAQKNLDLNYYLPEGTSYNKAIPTPESVIGHEVGEWHITHDKLVLYMKALDAGLRFRGHPFARLDDENLAKVIESPLKVMCMAAKRTWMEEANDTEYPLRDRERAQRIWRFNNEEEGFGVLVVSTKGDRFIRREDLVSVIPAVPNRWLAWTREELMSAATEYRISLEDAFRLAIYCPNASDQAFEWDEAFGASRPLKNF
jgi:hypothetical protein